LTPDKVRILVVGDKQKVAEGLAALDYGAVTELDIDGKVADGRVKDAGAKDGNAKDAKAKDDRVKDESVKDRK
jgi:hypothetical protein